MSRHDRDSSKNPCRARIPRALEVSTKKRGLSLYAELFVRSRRASSAPSQPTKRVKGDKWGDFFRSLRIKPSTIVRPIWGLREGAPARVLSSCSNQGGRVGDGYSAVCTRGHIPTVAIYAFVQQPPAANLESALHILGSYGNCEKDLFTQVRSHPRFSPHISSFSPFIMVFSSRPQ